VRGAGMTDIELVQALRACGQGGVTCVGCPVKYVSEESCNAMLREAANRLEELSGFCEKLEDDGR